MYSIREVLAFYSHFKVSSVKWRQFRVTSGHIRSHDVISCRVAASSCKLHLCRKLSVKYTRVLSLLQPLWCDFRSNDVTSGPLPVTWGHVTSFPVTWLHPPELQLCRKWNLQYTGVLGLLQPLPADFRSNDVTSGSLSVTLGHVTSFSVTWLPPPVSYSLVKSEMYSMCKFLAFYSHFQVTSVKWRHFLVTWNHVMSFLSRDWFLLRATALWEVKCTV